MKNKKTKLFGILIITLLIIILTLFSTIFQKEINLSKIVISLIIMVMASVISIIVQKKIDFNYKKDCQNHSNIDFMKYILSIIIIIVHLRPFLYVSNQLDVTFNNIIGRICVPFFFVITGYFVGKKDDIDGNYINIYIKKLIPLYLVWNIIYIPIVLSNLLDTSSVINNYIPNMNLLSLIICLPIFIIAALLYTGFYYHLWYFPAVMLALWVLKKWNKKWNIKYLLLISFVLLLLGATETYYGLLPNFFKHIVDYYYHIFYTSRNFLFFGLFYIVCGYYMGNKKKIYATNCFIKLLLSFILLIFEGMLLQNVQRLDSNILLSCVPLIYYLVISIIYMNNLVNNKISHKLRNYSKYYYLIHPAIIFSLTPFLIIMEETLFKSIILIILVFTITHIITLGLVRLYQKNLLV